LIPFLSMTGVWVVGLSLATFLILTWALRGAPIGQAVGDEEDGAEAPRAGYRDRVVTAAVVGLVMVGVGAYVAATVSIPWSLPLFAAGFGTVLTLVSVNRRYRHASPTLRRVVAFSDSALTASLLGGILIVGNVLAFKYGGHAIDLTGERAFSLSSQTVNVLKSLARPVKLTAFFAGGEPSLRVVQLLDLYKAENPGKVQVDTIHPFRDVERFGELRERVPDVSVAAEQGGGVVIEYGEGDSADRVVVQGSELFQIPRDRASSTDPTRFESTFRGEDALTSALIRLREGKKSPVAFTTGHGEPPIDQPDPRQSGLGLFRARLAATGADVHEVNLLRQDVPESTSLVVIVAPKSPFQPEEIDRLKAYLSRGGHLLAILGGQEAAGREEWLKTYNIELGAGRVFEPRQRLRGRLYAIAPIVGGLRHPIIESLGRNYVVMPNAVPMTLLGQSEPGSSAPEAAPNPSMVARPIVRTTAESWVESDPNDPRPARDPAKERGGPITIGAAVEDLNRDPKTGAADPQPRLVVFSSPDMADNALFASFPTNQDLLMNSVHWLRGRPELQGIAPKTHVAVTFVADPRLRARLILVPTLIAALIIVGLGVTTYLARRA
jgi:hypothetical protein